MRSIRGTGLLARRHLVLLTRRPSSIIGAVVLPLLFAVLLHAVFAGVMARRGIDYVDHLVPAVLLQASFFTAMSAALIATEEIGSGLLTRLRAMPVGRVAPLLGLLAAMGVRGAISLVVVLALGVAAGYRLVGGWPDSVAYVALALGFTAAISTAFVGIGYRLGSIGAVQAVTNLIFFPLLLLSSAFTPAGAFPAWLAPVVAHQPVSVVADTLRALAAGAADAAARLPGALGWLVGFAAVGIVLVRRARSVPG